MKNEYGRGVMKNECGRRVMKNEYRWKMWVGKTGELHGCCYEAKTMHVSESACGITMGITMDIYMGVTMVVAHAPT